MAVEARGDEAGQREAPEAIPTYANITYRTVGDRTLALDIYLPRGTVEPPPVVLCIHGGAWRGGSKEGMRGACGTLADAGFAAVAIQYRLSQEASFPAQIHDCKAAVRWIRQHAAEYGWDPERVAAFGTSAGGHLAALLGASGGVIEKTSGDVTLNIAGAESDGAGLGSRVQVVVDFYGPTDFAKMDSYPSRIEHDAPDSPESELIGAPIQKALDRVALANPITYIDSGDPPFYIAHGKADMAVPFNQSERLQDRLAEVGAPFFFHPIEGAGHGGERFRQGRPMDSAIAYLQALLGMPASQTNPWTALRQSDSEAIRHRSFYSRILGRDYGYGLYLPPGYADEGERRYPVVYWLHGRNGDALSFTALAKRLDEALRSGAAPPMVAIGATGLAESMWRNGKGGAMPVADVFLRELMPHVEGTYRIRSGREARVLEGFSMGGFGAAAIGFEHPDLFGSVSILGAAMHRAEFLRDERRSIFDGVFGGDFDYCRRNTPWSILERGAEEVRGRQRIRLLVGEKDPLAEKNRQFHELLRTLGIEHEFALVPDAGHNAGAVMERYVGDFFAFYPDARGLQEMATHP